MAKQLKLLAFGEYKTINEWLADPRCQVLQSTLIERLKAGNMTVEDAITTPPSAKSKTKHKYKRKD